MKRIWIGWSILLLAVVVQARGKNGNVSHRPLLEVGIAECNMLTTPVFSKFQVKDMPGLGGHIGLGYEMGRGRMFGGITCQLDYAFTRLQVMNYDAVRTGYADKLPGGAEVRYHYIYDTFEEIQHQWSVGLMLYAGGELMPDWYMLGGLKLSAIVSADYRTHVSFSTCKQYCDIFGQEEWVDVADPWAADGNYPVHALKRIPCEPFTWGNQSPANTHPMRFRLSPVFETGWKHMLGSGAVPAELRIGAYAEWGMPLFRTETHNFDLVDYSALENRRNAAGLILIPDNQDQLDDLLHFNSVLNSRYLDHSSLCVISQLSVGIRLRFAWHVEKKRYRSSHRTSDCKCL